MTLVTPALALALAATAGWLLAAGFEARLRAEMPFVGAALLLCALAAAAPSLWLLALVVVLAAALQAQLRPGRLPLRAPCLAAGLLVFAGLAARSGATPTGARLGALAAALAVAALAGLAPFLLPPAGEKERPAAGDLAWSAFLGPALSVAAVARTLQELPAAASTVFGGVLLGLGCLNVAWGLARALAADDAGRARSLVLAEWGLALIGLGLLSRDGDAAAYLVLAALLLLRLPLLLWSERQGLPAALALAGSPPFAGFPGRLLLLRAATALAWPLALALAAALLLMLPASMRTVAPSGGRRQLAGQAVALALSAAVGLYPAALLRPVGL